LQAGGRLHYEHIESPDGQRLSIGPIETRAGARANLQNCAVFLQAMASSSTWVSYR